MVSTGEIEVFLKGIEMPAKKSDLISRAKSNNAPQEVMDILNRLPDQTYHSPTDVAKAVGNLNR